VVAVFDLPVRLDLAAELGCVKHLGADVVMPLVVRVGRFTGGGASGWGDTITIDCEGVVMQSPWR
jgi:hypothetical protein